MGKPSTQLSRRSSTLSLNGASSKTMNMNISPMALRKASRAKLKRIRKTESTIKKLFSRLRHDSKCRLSSSKLSSPSCETSVIEIDDSLNNTVLLVQDLKGDVNTGAIGNVTETIKSGNVTQTARKGNRPGYRKSKVRPIIIDDEPGVSTPQKNTFPIHHSTPMKQKPSIDELIVDVNNQLMNESNNNRTKNINASSFLTIDLTTESTINKSAQQTIIDLDSTTNNQDCVLTSVSQSSSMSGDSDVTVLRGPVRNRSITQQIKTGLVNLNASEKDKILAFISENVFNGCSIPSKIQPRVPETAEDTYIKEVIVGKKLSRNSIGSNVYNPEKYVNRTGLRMIVIDGSNVAMAHGFHRYFSVPGLKIVIDYFLSRGHTVKAFVPRFRNKCGKSSQPQMLMDLERQGHVIFTPSREVFGRNISSYDDRYIIQCAAEFEGVIVSNDCFKDLIRENPRWADVINNRVLQYNWVQGMIMFPRDPLGRNGPTLEKFLKMPWRNSRR